MSTHFSCVGCGKCCTSHHIPLTLSEAIRWVQQQGELIVLVEAFLEDGQGISQVQREHAEQRSLPVWCGETRAYVAITFAAYNPGRCMRLDADNRCSIYDERPLVCRIYPMEINPHLPLRPHMKDCPPHAWEQGPTLIHGGRLLDEELIALIERSRQADRDEIGQKAAICTALGIRTSALKGDGFTAYRPYGPDFLAATEQVMTTPPMDVATDWALHVSHRELAEQLKATGALITSALTQTDYGFIALSAA